MSSSSESFKGVLTATAAAAAIASIAVLQKKRAASVYRPQQLKAVANNPNALGNGVVNGHANGHHHAGSGAVPPSYDEDYELYDVDYTMHVEHRAKLIQRMMTRVPGIESSASAILLHGGDEIDKYDTDTQYAFRQESFFHYLFGVREPGCAGMIDLRTKQAVLFVPRLSAEWELWCGARKPLTYFQQHYKVDAVHYMDEMRSVIESKYNVEKLYLLKGRNTDSGLQTVTTSTFEGIDRFARDYDVLHGELVECRVIKTEKELDLLRFTNLLSSGAHIEVMKSMRPGKMEFHAESLFLHYCYSHSGARAHAYTCICGSGANASTLHYGHAGAPNDKLLEDGDIFLNDMGAELHCYASDITCSFPVNGHFTADQRMIYEGVLKSHDAVIEAMKPGVSYVDMHLLSHRVLTQHLLEHGLFQNGTVDELMDHEISAYFYPHGLGHLMGLDVHDVGGVPQGMQRPEQKILKKLRCLRVLEKNMVLTVEPGCYFIEAQLEELLANPTLAKFVNQEMLARFRGSGGVRIESDVIVTSTGCENMTRVPRTVEEVEGLMKTKQWP